MHGEIRGLLSLGKNEQRTFFLFCGRGGGGEGGGFFLSCVQCFRAFRPLTVRPNVTTDGRGIFNVHIHLGACRTHELGIRKGVDSEG